MDCNNICLFVYTSLAAVFAVTLIGVVYFQIRLWLDSRKEKSD